MGGGGGGGGVTLIIEVSDHLPSVALFVWDQQPRWKKKNVRGVK